MASYRVYLYFLTVSVISWLMIAFKDLLNRIKTNVQTWGWKDICTLGFVKYSRSSVLHGVYIGFGVLILFLVMLAILSFSSAKSVFSSIEYITDDVQPILNQANEIEIKMLVANTDLNNLLVEKDFSKLDDDIKTLEASRKDFLESLDSFTEISRDFDSVMEHVSKLTALARGYLDETASMPERRVEFAKLVKASNKNRSDFRTWLDLFHVEEQNLKASIFDDYVAEQFMNMTSAQSPLESKTNELLTKENHKEIMADLEFIAKRYTFFEEFLNSLRVEMPELDNNMGQYFRSFKYNLTDKKGLLYEYAHLVEVQTSLEESAKKSAEVLGKIEEEIRAVQDLAKVLMRESTGDSKETYSTSNVSMIIALVFAVILSSLILLAISNSIRRPMRKIVEGLRKISFGNMKDRLVVEERNEFGKIAHYLNELTTNVGGVLSQISDASIKLKDASSGNLKASDSAHESIDVQRTETVSVSSSIQEMLAAINEVDNATDHTLSEVKHAEELTTSSQTIMEETIATAENLETRLHDTTDVIMSVNNMSEEIAKIVNIINGVADQTNLLALNAAIESARAGEYGRGFAVVADEVRSLANTTASSTNEIRTMIANLQAQVKKAVEHSALCVEEMNLTKKNSLNTSQVISEIRNSVRMIADMSSTISAATKEQSRTSSLVSENLKKINEISVYNLNQFDAVANSSKEVDNLASIQEKLVSKFVLPKKENTVAKAPEKKEVPVKASANKVETSKVKPHLEKKTVIKKNLKAANDEKSIENKTERLKKHSLPTKEDLLSGKAT